jgi:hypothetical protein
MEDQKMEEKKKTAGKSTAFSITGKSESGVFFAPESCGISFCPRSGRHFGLLQRYRGADQDLRVLQT